MRLFAIAFALGLALLVAWFVGQTQKPGPNVGELDGLAVLRLMAGNITPPDYCARRGLKNASTEARAKMQKMADDYAGFAPAARDAIKRTFFAVPPARQPEFDQAQKFITALQNNQSLVTEPSFRPHLVIIVEFLERQCAQLVVNN